MIAVLAPFAGLFSAPGWSHAQVLLMGASLCQGPRPVAAVLRVLGLGQEPRLERYHRVLSRARWSGLQAAKSLLGVVIQVLPARWVALLVVDDPVERRRGKRIKAKGCYRDPVRSTTNPVVKCCGLKWLSLLGGVCACRGVPGRGPCRCCRCWRRLSGPTPRPSNAIKPR
jgi:hypothetical protein